MHVIQMKFRGISVVEVLVTIAVLAILSTIGFVSYSSFVSKNVLDKSAKSVMAFVEETRLQSIASKNGERFGVHFEADGLTRFPGGTFVLSDPSNVLYPLDADVSVSAINLADSSSDVVFSRINGKASTSGVIELSLVADPSQKKQLRVEPTGLVFLQ